MEKILILCRGISGSGKSTFAKTLGCPVYEADSFFMVHRDFETNEIITRHQVNGEYIFDPTKLKEAHESCRNSVEGSMIDSVSKIAVSNTFTQLWEIEPYFEMAKKHGYKVFSIVVENRHGGTNVHGVPADKLEQMKERFEIKL
jgi:predicted kinase